MEKKRKLKRLSKSIKINQIIQPRIENIELHEMYEWEKMFLSKKGRKESLKGYG
jgi:hypothetical protein